MSGSNMHRVTRAVSVLPAAKNLKHVQYTQVYAFLPPTRVMVAAIVREKELRLREGMRILGLRASV